jgi:acetyl-CoA C-acetyltransferase
MSMAHTALADLSLAEVHDCFTIAELNLCEALGMTARGQGRRVLEEGRAYREVRLPISPSGGLKAKGHPAGATGVSRHALCAPRPGDAGSALATPTTAAPSHQRRRHPGIPFRGNLTPPRPED